MRGIKPGVAGRELKKLCGDGGASTEKIVNASRPKDAPLHSWFTWDNNKAGELYRRSEAGMLMRFCVEIRENKDGADVEVPVVCYAPSDGDGSEMLHVQTSEVMDDPHQRQYVIQAALDGLLSWKNRYAATLKEFAGIVSAIDSLKV